MLPHSPICTGVVPPASMIGLCTIATPDIIIPVNGGKWSIEVLFQIVSHVSREIAQADQPILITFPIDAEIIVSGIVGDSTESLHKYIELVTTSACQAMYILKPQKEIAIKATKALSVCGPIPLEVFISINSLLNGDPASTCCLAVAEYFEWCHTRDFNLKCARARCKGCAIDWT